MTERAFVNYDKHLRGLKAPPAAARFRPMSRTFLAVLQFDGGGFVGWQRQALGRSVQGEVEGVLQRLTRTRITAHGAGRTDAGVHAEGMGVSFTLPDRWDAVSVRRAMNALLPDDCRIRSVLRAHDGFHARKSARSRRYRYLVGTDDDAASPFRRHHEWPLCRPLDGATLTAAADIIQGEHQFEAFAARGQLKPHYHCRLGVAEWHLRPAGRGYEFRVEGDRFLHHMVRMLVGTMVDIARGRRPADDMEQLLASRDNAGTSAPAPPEGLYFVAATYPASAFPGPTEETHDASHRC